MKGKKNKDKLPPWKSRVDARLFQRKSGRHLDKRREADKYLCRDKSKIVCEDCCQSYCMCEQYYPPDCDCCGLYYCQEEDNWKDYLYEKLGEESCGIGNHWGRGPICSSCGVDKQKELVMVTIRKITW